MRDIALTAIVLAGLVFAFKRPWFGVALWTWISLMSPHRMTFGFAYDLPFAAMIAGVTILSLFISQDKVSLPMRGPVYILILFVVWMGLTTAFAVFPGDSAEQLWKVVKIQAFTLIALAVLHKQEEIRAYVLVNVFSIAFFGVKGGIFTILRGGESRVWGPGGFIAGNNEVGLAMIMVIPLIYYLYLQSTQKWVRYALLVSMFLTAVAVLGTHSRGALVGIVAMGGVLWLRAPQKLLSGLIIVAVSVVGLAFMSSSFLDRMGTIQTYEEDASAVGRIYAWKTAINIANSRPLGAGFAMYDQRIADMYGEGFDFAGMINAKILQARAAHSIYFQILGEHGWIGLVLFLFLFLSTWRMATRIRRQVINIPEFRWVYQLAGMCQVSLAGFAAGGAFLSMAYFDLPYNIMVIIVVIDRWVNLHRSTTPASGRAPVPAPAEFGPVVGR